MRNVSIEHDIKFDIVIVMQSITKILYFKIFSSSSTKPLKNHVFKPKNSQKLPIIQLTVKKINRHLRSYPQFDKIVSKKIYHK